jgi:hypothetical protein
MCGGGWVDPFSEKNTFMKIMSKSLDFRECDLFPWRGKKGTHFFAFLKEAGIWARD